MEVHAMIYRLPCLSDEKMLREYVHEHHDHGETGISAGKGFYDYRK